MTCQCKDKNGNYIKRRTDKCVFYEDGSAGILETNADGNTRLATGCMPYIGLRWLGYVCKTVDGAAAAVESNRNVVADGLNAIVTVARLASAKQIGGTFLPAPEEHNG